MQELLIAEPRTLLDKRIKELLMAESEPVVILHCRIQLNGEQYLRMQPSTFLVHDTTACSSLLHVFNISYPPQWTYHPQGEYAYFTLIFEGLPKDCKEFYMLELTLPGVGKPFYSQSIQRNSTDVYRVQILSYYSD